MSELKCPFCQQEAHITEWESANSEAYCSHCDTTGDLKLWQELIRTRKALDVAVDALEMIDSGKILEHSVFGHENETKTKIAHSALEQITAIEQKDVK